MYILIRFCLKTFLKINIFLYKNNDYSCRFAIWGRGVPRIWDGGQEFFFFRFVILHVAKRHAAKGEAMRIAMGVRGHAPARNFFKTVQYKLIDKLIDDAEDSTNKLQAKNVELRKMVALTNELQEEIKELNAPKKIHLMMDSNKEPIFRSLKEKCPKFDNVYTTEKLVQ